MTVAEEIFGVKAVKKSKKGSGSSKTDGEVARRPDGVSREVYFLTAGATPASIAPTVPPSVLQSKPTQKRAWKRQKFSNLARNDGLELEHWVRVGEHNSDYPFAMFNRSIRMVTYSSAEYEAVVKNLTPVAPVKPTTQTESGRRPPLPKRPRVSSTRSGVSLVEQNTLLDSLKRGVGSGDNSAASDSALSPPLVSSLTSPAALQSESRTTGNADDRKDIDYDEASAVSSPLPHAEGSGENSRLNRSATASGVLESIQKSQQQADITQGRLSSSNTEEGVPGSSSSLVTGTLSPSSGQMPGYKKALHYVPPQQLWTREETDTLFQLCQQFDLRFAVIYDRWPDNLPPRSIDELKDRYYSVAKAVTEYRMNVDKAGFMKLPTSLQKHCQMINCSPFDYEYECIRKNQLERQYRRSKEELREEEETVRNARRIESTQRRLKKERERLAKLLTPMGDILMTGADGSRVVDAKVAMANASVSQSQKLFPHRRVSNGAYARSSLIYTPVTQSARIAKKVDQVLDELGVGTRPTPTSHVVDTFDLLRMDILSFLELHRTLLRKEEETHALRVRVAKLKQEPVPNPPEGVVFLHKKRKVDDSTETGLPTSLFS